MTYESFASELQKIAADRDLLGKKERKRVEDLEAGRKTLPTRLVMGGAGLSMAAGSLPITAKALSPAPTLYHGTTMASAEKILNLPTKEGKRGILTQFAGKAGRLNEQMLASSIIEAAENAGVKLTNEEIVKFVTTTQQRMKLSAQISRNPDNFVQKTVKALQQLPFYQSEQAVNREKRIQKLLDDMGWRNPNRYGTPEYHAWEARRESISKSLNGSWYDYHRKMKAKDWEDKAFKKIRAKVVAGNMQYDSTDIVENSARELLESKGYKGEKLNNVMSKLRETSKFRGKRIYFGWHPSTVVSWGNRGSELELYGQKIVGEFAELKETKQLIAGFEERIRQYMPPGTNVPSFPKLHAVGGFDEIKPLLGEWANTILRSTQGQIEANLKVMPPGEALGRMPELFGLDPDDISKAFKGDEAAQRKIEGAIEKFIKGAATGSIDEKTVLGKEALKFSNDGKAAFQAFAKRKGLKVAVDTLTFGVASEARNIAQVVKYRPTTTQKVTADEAGKILKKLVESGSNHQVVFGAKAPAGTLRWMTDFPFLSGLLAINPGLKYGVSEFIPNFDPGRDISTHLDIPRRQIRTIDIVNPETKAIQRLKIRGAKSAPFKVGRYLRGAGVVAPMAAIGALGADIAQAGIRGKKTYTEKLFAGELDLKPSKKNPLVKRWQRREMSKAAAEAYWQELEKIGAAKPWTAAAGKVLKFTVPATTVGAATGFGAEMAVEHVMPVSKVRKMSEPKKSSYIGARMAVGGLASTGLVYGIGFLAKRKEFSSAAKATRAVDSLEYTAANSAKRNALNASIVKSTTKIMAALGAAALVTTAASVALGMTDAVRRGTPAHALSPINLPLASPKGKKLVQKSPQVASLPMLATIAAVPALAAYAARRYYPGQTLRVGLAMKDKLDPVMASARKSTAKWLRKKKMPTSAHRLESKQRSKYGF